MQTLKRVWRTLGAALAIAAGGYFLYYASRSLAGYDLQRLLEPRLLVASTLLTLAYMALIPITATAWVWLLRALGEPAAAGVTVPVMAASQFGKYLPGNVAQHFGRVVISRSLGLATGPVVISMLYETMLVVAACAHAGALSLLWSPPPALQTWPLFQHQIAAIALVTLAAVAGIVALPHVVRRVAMRRGTPQKTTDRAPNWNTIAACYAAYIANYALIGAGLWFAARFVVSPDADLPAVPFFIGAFASSWILGFLAPGAPAGLGVREAALALWFEPVLGGSASVLLIVLLRVATTLGDAINFAWGSTWLACLRRRRPLP